MFTGFIVNIFSKIDNQINNIYNTFITFVRFKEKFEIRKQFFFLCRGPKSTNSSDLGLYLITQCPIRRSLYYGIPE